MTIRLAWSILVRYRTVHSNPIRNRSADLRVFHLHDEDVGEPGARQGRQAGPLHVRPEGAGDDDEAQRIDGDRGSLVAGRCEVHGRPHEIETSCDGVQLGVVGVTLRADRRQEDAGPQVGVRSHVSRDERVAGGVQGQTGAPVGAVALELVDPRDFAVAVHFGDKVS